MRAEVFQELKEMLGERASDSLFERSFYERDLGPVPALMTKALFKTLPDAVVKPASTEEVAAVMRLAWREGIPVTPRAGGSTVYFDAVPVKAGILMDLNLLKGVEGHDPEAGTVSCLAATTWQELERYLARYQLAVRSMPSSAPAATVGGWIAMMGYGIGSLRYGSVISQVKSLEVVLPDGETRTLTRTSFPPLHWFEASEGTLGIITRVELLVRPATPYIHYLADCSDLEGMGRFIDAVLKGPVTPYNIHFSDRHTMKAYQRLSATPVEGQGSFRVAVTYSAEPGELEQVQAVMPGLADQNRVRLLPDDLAAKEWEERFNALWLKRGGPSVLGGEIWLPVKNLEDYLEQVYRLSQSLRITLMSYGHVVTRDYATVMTMFYTDERHTIDYILSLGLVKKIQDIGYHCGGSPYGTGLWNTPYITRSRSSAERADLRSRKERLDKKNLMNPGKVYRWPLMLNPMNFSIGMGVFTGIKRLKGGRQDEEPAR